ncbi:MAG TPA: hypothetical protein PLB02_09180 [Thermoanaerobaculia bacterium]|nr:hypothetical protein [Thermoanaerobaculia bacterium]HQR67554.1 hypothetical protein [Thermoanaerobaculia bacterium]
MTKKKAPRSPARVRRVPDIKPGKYSDGLPFDQIRYLQCKIILKPNHFTSRESLFDFAKLMRRPAREHGVGFDTEGFAEQPLQIREVLFLDTPDFRLYNNGFILRRRIPYKDGFPIGDPEIVFKYRGPDLQKAAETDVRPRISGDYNIKFKAEALPLKDGLGGMRILFSHNVEFGLSSVKEADRMSMDTILRVLPALEVIRKRSGERLDLVSGTIVEEVLQDIGVLDFGPKMKAVANVALWRNRGDHSPLIGEFAFQIKFRRREDLNQAGLAKGEKFFLALQESARDWIALGATKTGVVYRLKGNPPRSHE